MADDLETEADLTGVAPRTKPKPSVETIGGRKLKPATMMMGHGYDPALSEGSLKPPIFATSTYVFPNAAAGKRHFEGVMAFRLLFRFCILPVLDLEDELAGFESNSIPNHC